MNEEKKVQMNRPASFTLIALVLGMVALAGSVGHFWLGPIEPPPKLEDSIANHAVKIRNKVVAKLKNEDVPRETYQRTWDADQIAMASIAGTSVLAIILSVIGFVRHEPVRMVGSAAVLGGSALALQYLVIAIGAIVFAIILAAVLNGLDFSP